MPPVPKVLIATDVIHRLKNLPNGITGVLLGQLHETNSVIFGLGISSSASGVPEDLMLSVPYGAQISGAFTSGTDVNEAKDLFSEYSKSFDCSDIPLLLTNVHEDLQSFVLLNGNTSKVPLNTVNSGQLAAAFVYFRVFAEIPISFDRTSQGIKQALEDIKTKVLNEEVAFMLTSTSLFLGGSSSDKISGQSGITADHRVKDLFDSVPERGSKDHDVVPVTIYIKKTKEFEQDNPQSIVPHIRQVRRPFESAHMTLKVDVLGLVHRNAKVATLFNALSGSFSQGLKMLEMNLIQQVSLGPKKTISLPELYHFLPANSSHIVTVVYPKSCSDAELKQQRELLHKRFGFAVDQPLFRRSQAYKFPGDSSSSGPLLNPHEGLNSGVKGGQASLVKGLYSYHHYMQDRFDDNGWGCAYRSLQTICSWFRLQGYTEVQVPTHKQIQECLVKIGDKPSSFIGSRQWIGSTEVSFVLETLLGVTCKILTASTGEEVGSLGSELSYHFQTHGTPIMIGGGVLAHTIIGVDYNRSTGDIKFLILDPHYTGGEDLNVITGKGWVGWKDIKFWTKNAFYNLCLPLRPIGDI